MPCHSKILQRAWPAQLLIHAVYGHKYGPLHAQTDLRNNTTKTEQQLLLGLHTSVKSKHANYVSFEHSSAQQLQLLGDKPVWTQIHKSLPLSFAAPQHYVFACMTLQVSGVAGMSLDATLHIAQLHLAGEFCSERVHACRLTPLADLHLLRTRHKGYFTLKMHIALSKPLCHKQEADMVGRQT